MDGIFMYQYNTVSKITVGNYEEWVYVFHAAVDDISRCFGGDEIISPRIFQPSARVGQPSARVGDDQVVINLMT